MKYSRPTSQPTPPTFSSEKSEAVILRSIQKLLEDVKELKSAVATLRDELSHTSAALAAANARIAELETEKEAAGRAEATAKSIFTGPTGILGRMGHMIADGLAGMAPARFAGIYALPVANKLSTVSAPESSDKFYTRLFEATRPVLAALAAPDFEDRAMAAPETVPVLMRRLSDALATAGIEVIYPADPGSDPALMQRPVGAGSPDVPALVRKSDRYIYAYGGTSRRL